MKALYQLSRHIAGFDFFIWLVMQKSAGADGVVFDTRNPRTNRWSADVVMKRFASILWPGPALAGMTAATGTDGAQLQNRYTQPDLIRLCHQGLQVPRLKSVLPPGSERYTITLRNDPRLPARNSDDEAWKTFGAEIGARIIPDFDDQPIDLHERMALYAGARMNFFVTNGPVMLCFLSEYPAMGFDVHNSPPQQIPFGGSYPWLMPDRHYQFWEDDSLENIRRRFEAWEKSRWV